MIRLIFSILSACCALVSIGLMCWAYATSGGLFDVLFAGVLPLMMSGVLAQAN